jgi:hypothetical protein
MPSVKVRRRAGFDSDQTAEAKWSVGKISGAAIDGRSDLKPRLAGSVKVSGRRRTYNRPGRGWIDLDHQSPSLAQPSAAGDSDMMSAADCAAKAAKMDGKAGECFSTETADLYRTLPAELPLIAWQR